MEKPIVIRQGDVCFIEQNQASQERPSASEDAKAGIFARGESTGHMHRLAEPSTAVILETWRDRFVRVGDRDAEVVHEEHSTVRLPANKTFAVRIAREFDYTANSPRYVVD